VKHLYHSHTGIFNIWDDPSSSPDPTGATDSSPAFLYAINEAYMNGGGIVYVPPGNYKIQYTLPLPPYVQLVGRDQSSTSITAMANLSLNSTSGYTTVMVTNTGNMPGGPSGQQYGIGVRGITFNGSARSLDATAGDHAVIEFLDVSDVTIESCTIQNCQTHAISIDASTDETDLRWGTSLS
jgi:hypothetical protein